MKRVLLCAAIFCAAHALDLVCAASESPRIASGGLEVSFDTVTGQPNVISYRSEPLVQPTPTAIPFTFGTGPTNHVVWLHDMKLGRRLIDARFKAEAAEIVARYGDFEVVEQYRVRTDPPRLERSARLTQLGRDALKLRGATFQTFGFKLENEGYAWFPERWPTPRSSFATMESGRRESGGGTIAPVVTVLRPGRSLLWLSCTDDMPSVFVRNDDGRIGVGQSVNAVGHLMPGRPQEFGVVSMMVADGDHRAALDLMPRWLNANAMALPKDRAAWSEGAILYAFHPGGTIGSNWKDLGGFRAATERLVPSLQRLGVTAAWILPVEYRSPYWPLDYYRFMDGLGDAEAYRELVARLHASGLKVIQDLVPHGGSPEAEHNKAHPEFMLRREDGSTLRYWLNDFARKDWQDYIAGVAAHYMERYDVDGYRMDACMGSKEPNWDPAIAYPRASMAGLWGGLRMIERIRSTVKGIKPADGAILAETQSVRHLPFCDLMYDFRLCYETLHGWHKMPAAEFVAALIENLEDQRQTTQRGAIWLRHIESHDSLRSQLWYGVEGMRAFYALSAWIDGVPMIYQGMEKGHGPALRRINAIRLARPEIGKGTVNYRDVQCDTPGVFACLRELGERRSVAVINFNREPVHARLTWPGGSGEASLRPLGYTVLPPPLPEPTEPSASRPPEAAVRKADVVVFDGAEEWFVDTVEGRLRDKFVPLRPGDLAESGSIYRRPQGTPDIWRHDMQPLHPTRGVGVLQKTGGWTLFRPKTQQPFPSLRLVERHQGKPQLALVGLDGEWEITAAAQPPPAPDPTEATDFGGVTLRVVGPDYIVANKHYEVVLGRQGGVIRWLRANGKTLARDWDLYGDQDYFRTEHASRMAASNEVESTIRFVRSPGRDNGFFLLFDGEIRGANRFARKRPGVSFHNQYHFDASAQIHQWWSFGTEKSFCDKKAFLAMWVEIPEADKVRFLRKDGSVSFEGVLAPSRERSGQTRSESAPDAIEFGGPGGVGFTLRLMTDPAVPCNFFMQGRRLFGTLLDGQDASMDEGRRYAFVATWEIGPGRGAGSN